MLEALTPKTRAFVQFKDSWIETYEKQVPEIGEDGEETTEITSMRLTYVGKMNVRKAIERVKTSYFMSIEKHGIAHGSKVHKDFLRLRDEYTRNTLPQWFEKMEIQYGVAHEELLNAYVEQMTGLRVIKPHGKASMLGNILLELEYECMLRTYFAVDGF